MVSRASIYPIQGLAYFVAHPSLWRKCICGLLITLLFAFGSLVGFGFLVKPTADFLTLKGCPHWLSIIVSIVFMIIESAVSVILFSLIFLPILQEEIFVHTIKLRGYKETILDRPFPNMGLKMFYGSILYALVQVLTLVLTLPINLIPVVGTIAYCYLNGFVYAWGVRLSDLMPYRGLSFSQTRHYASDRYWSFMSFGGLAIGLEMIPLFNWLFIFTNVVGAALWAIDDYTHSSNNTVTANDTSREISPLNNSALSPPTPGSYTYKKDLRNNAR